MRQPKTSLRRKSLLHALALLVCLAGCCRPAAAATAAEMRQRVGIYIWGRVPDLATAASDAQRLGANQAIRAFIGPWSDTPPYTTDLRSLRQKLTLPGYQTLFTKFHVIMLTAYDSASYAKEYGSSYRPPPEAKRNQHHPSAPSLKVVEDLRSMPPQQAQQLLRKVHDEFREFSFDISKLDRTFIISNWESENDVPDPSLWPWFAIYLQARLDGIIEGREQARARGFPARVFTAFEFTIVPGFQGKQSGLVEIGAKLRGLDYVSYSAWHSIGAGFGAHKMKSSFAYAMQLIRGFCNQSGITQRIVIGEFGEYWTDHPSTERLKAIIDAAIEGGVEYLFNWVLYEQPGEKDEQGRDASHFGKFYLNHKLTPQGRAFRKLLLEESPSGSIP